MKQLFNRGARHLVAVFFILLLAAAWEMCIRDRFSSLFNLKTRVPPNKSAAVVDSTIFECRESSRFFTIKRSRITT